MGRMRRLAWLAAALLSLAAFVAAAPYVETARLLAGLTGRPVWAQRWIGSRTPAPSVEDLEIPTRHGRVAARLFRPTGTPRAHVIVFPGVHAGGVDEPRMGGLLARLAGQGALALTVPLPDLRHYRLTAASTDVVEDAIRWMSAQPSLAPSGRVAAVGASFAGGLLLVAAGRPSLARSLTGVASVGGHHDLPRVITFLTTGRLPNGEARPPHPYGQAVLAYDLIDRLVPEPERAAFGRALRQYLDAGSAESTDRPAAMAGFAEVRRQAGRLSPSSRDLVVALLDGRVNVVATRLAPFVREHGTDAALSPARATATSVPVFLLHGALDSVIPETELTAASADLEARTSRRPKGLVTAALSHADVVPAFGLRDAWPLVRFWRAWWAAASASSRPPPP